MSKKTCVFFLTFLFLTLVACFPIDLDIKYSLSVETEGQGEVIPDEAELTSETTVTLEVIPEDDWYFSHWDGPHGEEVVTVDESEGLYSIYVDEDKEITAVFLEI